VYVWGATHGFEWKDADMLKEYAYRAISGGGTRSVAGRAIRVDRGRAEKMIAAWRGQLAEGGAEPPA
jgi:hypothetical protein